MGRQWRKRDLSLVKGQELILVLSSHALLLSGLSFAVEADSFPRVTRKGVPKAIRMVERLRSTPDAKHPV